MTKKTDKTWDFLPAQLDAYRKGGFHLIPLNRPDATDAKGRPIGKAPLNSGWRRAPSLTHAEAVQLMVEEGHNVGVRLRDTDLVIDVDPRNFKEGDDPLKRLQADIGVDFSSAPTVETGSGGLHIYLRKPADVALRDSLDDYEGVEFKTLGRQVVAAGSVHPNTKRPYKLDVLCELLENAPEAPHALIEVAKRPGRMAGAAAGKLRDKPEALEEALQFLDAVEFGKGLHERWLHLMMACHHATQGEGRAEFLAWCATDPDYADQTSAVGRRWDSLHSDGTKNITWRHLFKLVGATGEAGKNWVRQVDRVPAEQDFPAYEDEDGQRDLDEILQSLPEGSKDVSEALEWFNKQGFCAVYDDGQFRVMRQVEDLTARFIVKDGKDDKPRMRWESAKRQDFLNYYETKKVERESTDAKGKTKSTVVQVAPLWLGWSGRREYEGVVFDPAGRFKNKKLLNLWTDWAVQPKKGDWSLLNKLLLEALCDGNEEAYEYCLDWAAYMVQFPDRPAEVAVVFRGEKGTGKGTWGRALARLCGRHSLQISDQNHLTSHFNAHMRDCLAGDTLILTKEHGSVAIGSVSGQHVTLLDGNGQWTKCQIVDHGLQETVETTFRPGPGARCERVRSTRKHGWIADGAKVLTEDLVPDGGYFGTRRSHSRRPRVDWLAPSKVVLDPVAHADGVLHGMVYGDGASRGQYDRDAFQLNVFSDYEDFEPWLAGLTWNWYHYKTAISEGVGRVYRVPAARLGRRDLKALPSINDDGEDYVLGFLRGWFAADGCMSTECLANLACGPEEEAWLRKWGPVCGWRFLGARVLPGTTNLGPRNKEVRQLHIARESILKEDLLLTKHRERHVQPKTKGWIPVSEEPGRFERVYCPYVPTTNSFALASGLHSSNCIMLFADEALWAGDKRAEGQLKRLITEDTLAIEAKGKDVVSIRNMLHVLIASNEQWVIPASIGDERRFAVNDVNNLFQGNHEFFTALNKQLDDGGLQALLWDLKTRDITGFHPRRNVPKTGALAKQKLASMDYLDQWWHNCLVNQSLGQDIHPAAGDWRTGRARYLSYDIQQSVELYLQKAGDRARGRRSTMTSVGERFKLNVPKAQHVRFMYPKDRLDLGEWVNKDGRTYGYDFPSVMDCRLAFEGRLGEALEWEGDVEDVSDLVDILDEFDPLA